MQTYKKEAIILGLQLLLFYVFPLTAGPTDAMGMVFLILCGTFFFSMLMGGLSKKKTKYLYPIITAVVFIPSVFIYYNESALIHALWYAVVAVVGILLGSLIGLIVNKLVR